MFLWQPNNEIVSPQIGLDELWADSQISMDKINQRRMKVKLIVLFHEHISWQFFAILCKNFRQNSEFIEFYTISKKKNENSVKQDEHINLRMKEKDVYLLMLTVRTNAESSKKSGRLCCKTFHVYNFIMRNYRASWLICLCT